MTKFGDWNPDIDTTDTEFVRDVLNMLPAPTGWGPWPSSVPSSLALSAACQGASIARGASGSVSIFAGTQNGLYRYVGPTDPWLNVSRTGGPALPYAVPTNERWKFKQFGPNLHAWNGFDLPQVMNVDSGTNFANTAGNPPIARTGAVIGGHIMLGSLTSARRAVFWCGLENDSFWTAGQKRSDFQEFPDGGMVRAITGYESGGVVLQTDAVRRIGSRTDRAVFEFYRIEDAQGTISPDSAVSNGPLTYYYGLDGFAVVGTDGSSQDIGVGVVDEWFKGTAHSGRLGAISGARDPTYPRIIWLFATTANAASLVLDHAVSLDLFLKKWTHADLSAECMVTAAAPGYTLEGLNADYPNIDAMTISLDSPIWGGGTPVLSCFDPAHKFAPFAGPNRAASIQSAVFQPIPGRHFYVNGFTVDTDTDQVTARIGVAERRQSPIIFNGPEALTDAGLVPAHAAGAYAVIQADIPAGTNWKSIRAFDFPEGELVDDGLQ